MDSSDFFTLDVADSIGSAAADEELRRFVKRHRGFVGRLEVPGVEEPLEVSEKTIADAGRKFLRAVQEAGRIYRRIAAAKGPDAFVTEVSMDETDQPQTPLELLLILAAVADEGVLPGWGKLADRGPRWEASTAAGYIQAGADIVVLAHPDAIRITGETIAELMG